VQCLDKFKNKMNLTGGSMRNENIFNSKMYLAETFDVYQKLADEIADFQADEREMTKYILGTINELDQPKTNMDRLNAAIGKFYKEVFDESLIRQRLEILHTTAEDIRQCQDLLRLIDCKNICTIGNEQKIKTNKEIFDMIKPFV